MDFRTGLLSLMPSSVSPRPRFISCANNSKLPSLLFPMLTLLLRKDEVKLGLALQ